MTTVRKQKSGDQLAVGDWLAPKQESEGAAEVLYALAYPASADGSRDNDGKHVHLVLREQGGQAPWATTISGFTLFDLASEEDLAALREQVERQRLADELRGLALLILNPAMPVPQYGIAIYGSFETPAEVRAAAEVFSLPVKSRKPSAGIQTPEWPEGRKSYEPGIHLHWLTTVDELESPVEPDADPTGLLHSRADDADDPTPVSGARVVPHVGGVTEAGLVDETEPKTRVGTNSGHGYAWQRPDGVKARCGGPGICSECSADQALVR